MRIQPGSLCFVSDDFYTKVQDPYLKINYDHTKRPHYYAYEDPQTGLYWLVPCSSRIDKFERLIEQKRAKHKPTDTIRIVRIFDRKTALLFQDMFPIAEHYIVNSYVKGGQLVRIADPNTVQDMERNARRVINLIRRGIRFTPTQPDALRIERLMLEEVQES